MIYHQMIDAPSMNFVWKKEYDELVSMGYGENAEVSKRPEMLENLKRLLMDRIADKEVAPIFYGQLERLEFVTERLINKLDPLPTVYWDNLMTKHYGNY
jgi:hypothetical protein